MDTQEARDTELETQGREELSEELRARLAQRDQILRELNDALDRDLQALFEETRAAA
jgi:hypothetical protein